MDLSAHADRGSAGGRRRRHHGGFLGPECGYAGKPEEFAERLREVLDGK